jgi:hypothetical protein
MRFTEMEKELKIIRASGVEVLLDLKIPQVNMQALTITTLNKLIADVKVIRRAKLLRCEVNTVMLRKQVFVIINIAIINAPIFAFGTIGECVRIYDIIPQKSKICRAYALLTKIRTFNVNENEVRDVTRY